MSEPCQKRHGLLVDGNLDMSQHWALTAQKANCILGCLKRSNAKKMREIILFLCSVLTRPHLCLNVIPQYRRDVDLLVCFQSRVTKMT